MKQFKNILILLIIIIIATTTLSACRLFNYFLPNNPSDYTPLDVYHEAWDIINEEYYDQDFNGMDFQRWKHRYDNVIKTNEDAHVAIQTMLESLDDRYTRLLTPDKFKEQDIDIEAKISGIGIQIADKDNKVYVVSVLEDTPAEKANLKVDDEIVMVENVPTKGLDLKDVADLIRGKVGTKVQLTVLRGDKKHVLSVERDIIRIKSVKQKTLKNNISYIRLYSFISQDSDMEMEDAVINSEKADAIILDLRNNHGGLLPNAISISNIFLDKGSIIVSIIGRSGDKQDLRALANSISDKPLVVLINGASASASEIVSGALKDHHRAILVGEKTFGKGMVQKIFQLPDDSGINVTVSKYLTPNGTDIDHKGISPDVEVQFTLDDIKKNRDVQLEEAKRIALKAIKEKKASKII